MNLTQTKLVGLTMELDLKAREYKMLCDELEKVKKKGIDPNDQRLLKVKELFQKNHDEIVEIKRKLEELKNVDEDKVNDELEKHSRKELFEQINNRTNIEKEEKAQITIVSTKKSLFSRILEKIKRFISK